MHDIVIYEPDSIPLQMTSFANRQPDPTFQVSETTIFTPDLCKASLAAVRFIRLATKPALTSTPVLFVKARAIAEKLLLLGHNSIKTNAAYRPPSFSLLVGVVPLKYLNDLCTRLKDNT